MTSEIIIKCSEAIAAKGWNIAFAESASAGKLSFEFSLPPVSGQILRGGIVCYEVFVKEQIMMVPRDLIEAYTPESAEVTSALAKSAAVIFDSDITVALTGLTTPGGSESEEKPVGTVFLSIITPMGTIDYREVFYGSPEQILRQAADKAALLIFEKLNLNKPDASTDNIK